MINLVDEFFKRNLTEPEAQGLDELLEKSPEEAMKFGDNLRREFLAAGLSVPPCPDSIGRFLLKQSPWNGALGWLTVGALVLAGTLGWWLRSHSITQVPVSATVPAVPKVLTRLKASLPPPPLEIPRRLTGLVAEGNRLSVIVELDKPAPVQVCILDPKKQNVRTLYQGSLPSGKWSIHWDGLLSDGSQAPTGDYRILVKSGATEMSKNVSIETGK